MNTVALITESLVRPAVLELINAQAEKLGMTWLMLALPSTTHKLVNQYMPSLGQRYWSSSGSSAITNMATKTMIVEMIIQYIRRPRYREEDTPMMINHNVDIVLRGQSYSKT